MAPRKAKNKAHAAPNAPPDGHQANTSMRKTPKSMVIRIGASEIGPSVSQLVKDVRMMMQPDTALRLKERKSNRLKDYTIMTGPLGVTHLLLFSRSTTGNTNLRIALTPRGPTLHFRVEKYALCKDVKRAMKRPKTSSSEYLNPPLLVMNNFLTPLPTDNSPPSVPKHLETLTTTVFQSLFPAISPQTTPLSSIRRVLLLNRELPKQNSSDNDSEDPGTYTINVRHYAITTKRTGDSRAIRRIKAAEKALKSSSKTSKSAVPNLNKLEDVADYILDPSAAAAASSGFTSGSESEAETDAEVEVLETQAHKLLSRKKIEQLERAGKSVEDAIAAAAKTEKSRVEKKAVKLTELGPRMRLRMTKVEEGVCGGKIMWHEFVKKTREEERVLDEVWGVRRREKEERRRVQRENVERKRREREGKGKVGKGEGEDGEEDGREDENEEEWYSDDLFEDEEEDEEADAVEEDGTRVDEMEFDAPAKMPLR